MATNSMMLLITKLMTLQRINMMNNVKQKKGKMMKPINYNKIKMMQMNSPKINRV